MLLKLLLFSAAKLHNFLPTACSDNTFNLLEIKFYLGSAELIHSHRLRGADVPPHCDNGDENSPYFGKDKTKFP